MHRLLITTRPLLVVVGVGTLTAIGPGQALGDPANRVHNYLAPIHSPARPDDRAGVRGVGAPDVIGYRKTASGRAQLTTGIRPDDKAGQRGISLGLSGSAKQPAAFPARPDDRAGVRGVGTPDVTGYRPTASGRGQLTSGIRPDDRAGPRGIKLSTIAAPPTMAVGNDGFDWLDAGVGAGGALALLAVGGIVVAAQRQRRGVPVPILHD